MFQDFKKIFQMMSVRRELIFRMAYKELTDRYAGSSLGLLLSILQPMLLIAVYTLVFTFVFRVRMTGVDSSPVTYAFWAIAGLIPWIAITEGVTRSVTSVTIKSAVVKQAIFPTEVLPVATALSALWPLVVSFVIYLVMLMIFIPHAFSWALLLLPLVFLMQILFTIGSAWFLSIVGVYFRDIGEFVTVLMMVGMFVTPILYQDGMIPAAFAWPMKFNPFAHLIYMYRDVVFYGSGNFHHPWSFLIFGVISVLVFWGGFRFFKKVQHYIANFL